MEENINRACNTLILQALLPEGGEGENAVNIAVEHIEVRLGLGGVYLVAIDPQLEVPGDPRFPDRLDELGHDGHVVVDHHHLWLLPSDHFGERGEAEAILYGLLEGSRIDHIDTLGVGAKGGREIMELLDGEMSEIDPGFRRELLENAVSDLGVASELVDVGRDKHETQLIGRGLGVRKHGPETDVG